MSVVTAIAVLIPIVVIGFGVYLLIKAGGVKILYALLLILAGLLLGLSSVGHSIGNGLHSVVVKLGQEHPHL